MTIKDKVLNFIEAFASLFLISILLVVLYYSLRVLLVLSNTSPTFELQMFYMGLLICVVTVIAQWIDGRVKVLRNMFNRKEVSYAKR